MAPVTTKEMTDKIASLEKRFDEMIDSIRGLFETQNNNVAMIATLTSDLADLKTDFVRLRNEFSKQESNGVLKYD